MKFSCFLILAFLSLDLQAADLGLAPSLRTYPFSASIEARARDEYLLWDQRGDAFWKYGFVQPQVTVATHGLAEASVGFFPVSIVELSAGLSTTSRFYNTKPFDCDQNVCQGILRRERLTARLLGGFEDWLGILSFNQLWVSAADDSKPFADEVEVLLAHPGHDHYVSTSLLFGKKMGPEFMGVFLKKGRYTEAHVENEFQYLVYKRPFESYSCLIGLGRYSSDFTQAGLSVYANLVWTWGKSLALY